MIKCNRLVFSGIFIFLTASALIFRIIEARHGLPYIYNFDEVITSGAALEMMKTGDFNPHTFNYGTLLIYMDYVLDALNFLYLMGKPTTATSYLSNMSDIHAGFVGSSSEWLWTISHPSFYFWNRMSSVILGLVTIISTFIISKHVTGSRWAALVAVAFLTSLNVHIQHSAYTTPDGPAACFVILSVLFACLFVSNGSRTYFFSSLVACGLAAAVKYNSGLVVVVPTAVLVQRSFVDDRELGMAWFLCILVVPAATFLLVMPYSLIDSVHFLEDVGEVVRNYKIDGHGDNSSNPGFDQLFFQLNEFYLNIGLLQTSVIVVGIIGSVYFRRLGVVLIFPIIYILYMVQLKVNFHRNYLQIYPFLAIILAVGARFLWLLVVNRCLDHTRTATMARAVLPSLFVVILGTNLVFAWINAVHSLADKDSRSRLINSVNGLSNLSGLIVPSDLHIHEQDLRRLKVPYSVDPIGKLAACTTMPLGNAIVLPLALAEDGETAQQKLDERDYEDAISEAYRGAKILLKTNGSPLYFNAPTRSPGLMVAAFTKGFCNLTTDR